MFRRHPTVVAAGMNRAMVLIRRLLPRLFVARKVANAAGASSKEK